MFAWLIWLAVAQVVRSLSGPPKSASINRDFAPLDKACGVHFAQAFLDDADINALLMLVNETGGWSASATAGAQYQQPYGMHNGEFLKAARQSPTVLKIEQRIAKATGIPVHIREDAMSLARITTRGHAPHGGHYLPFGLHHDSDGRPHRRRTVIVYLSSPACGGRTVFPLCGVVAPRWEATRAAFEAALFQQWGHAAERFSRHVHFDASAEHLVNDYLAVVCTGDEGLSVQPRAGDALMFDSWNAVTAQWNMRLFHDGCNVLDGEKLILQKFKEAPFASRDPALASFNDHDYRPYKEGVARCAAAESESAECRSP